MASKKTSSSKKNNYHSSKKKYVKPKTHSCFVCSKRGPWRKCKYCGSYFCKEHIKPHSVSVGLNNPNRYRGNGGHPCMAYSFQKEKEEKRKADEYDKNLNNILKKKKTSSYSPSKTISSSKYLHNKPRIKSHRRSRPKIKFRKIPSFVLLLVLGIISILLTFYFQNQVFSLIEWVIWILLTVKIYRKAFHWANRTNMANDLSFFLLRIVGGIVAIVGVYFGISFLFASALIGGSAFMTIPLLCLAGGLVVLSAFIAFKTNRRHHVVGIWGA